MTNILDGADFMRPDVRRESAVLLERARTARRQARDLARAYAHLAPRPHWNGGATSAGPADAGQTCALLRAAITEYTAALRTLDVPPGRALRLVKEAVIEVEIVRPVDAQAVADQLVRWFVEAYYRDR